MSEALTDRQRRVRDLVVEGLSNKQIGETLGISTRTVEEHRKAVYDKLDVRNAVELVRKTLGASE